MNSVASFAVPAHAHAFQRSLSVQDLRTIAPAIFAPTAHERMSARYTFIPTEKVLTGLMQAGFVAVDARQMHTRKSDPRYARHIVRLRRRFETVSLRDAIPEILFLNSHDGTSAYQIRLGLYRVVCTNGLIVSRGAFPAWRVSHRGDIVDEVVAGALELSERFEQLALRVERMEQRRLVKDEQLQLAEQALALRFPDVALAGMAPSQLLHGRRIEDLHDDLWSVFNRIQENLLVGGLSRRSATGRLVRTRRITSIREDVRLNSGLWDLAEAMIGA